MRRGTILLSDIVRRQNTLFYLRRFERLSRAPEEDIARYRIARLKELLDHCEKNVPFYRKRFAECGFRADRFHSIEQLKDIPLLTRQDLQESWNDIIADNYRDKRLYKGSSGGSTGQPVSYRKDSHANSAGMAAHLVGWSFSGWKMSMKGLHIWGNPTTVHEEWSRLSSKVKARVYRHHKFPAYTLHDGSRLNELYQLINRERYDYLDGYTNALSHFAEFMLSKGLSFRHQVRYVFTTAENLHHYQREAIESAIGPVYDTYGCSEINSIAYECGRCGYYHIIDPHVCLDYGEAVDSFGNCDLYVTDLDNFAFPMIRYRNGDMVIPAGDDLPECTIPFSRLKGVSGRDVDLITLPDGGILSVPSFFGSMLLKKVTGIRQYQVEKIDHNNLRIVLVVNERFRPEDMKVIEEALEVYIRGRMGYSVETARSVTVPDSGKFRLVIDRTVNS